MIISAFKCCRWKFESRSQSSLCSHTLLFSTRICGECGFSFLVIFQEYWCKRLHPKNVCEKVYRQPPLRESLKKGKLKKQDLAITKQKANVLRFADLIGNRIQYDCPGFLPNKRQVTLSKFL